MGIVFWVAAVSLGATGKIPRCPELPAFPSFASRDRLLVVVPHEDDETLGAGGCIQKALAAGAAVRVVYLTYGDHNELAFLLYRKRPWLTPAVNEVMGEVRRREATQAMSFLGVPTSQLVFLGYPDGGTLDIWKQHWNEAPALTSRSTRTKSVPYPDAASYGKPHKGEEIAADLERQLLDFRPTHILVTQPVDAHPDHRAAYLFLQVALRHCARRIPSPEIFTFPVHIGMWPGLYGFHPEEWLPVPVQLAEDGSIWRCLELKTDQVRRKKEAIGFYKSQLVDSKRWLLAFARRNELFSTPRDVPLSREWSPIHGVVARPETQDYEKKSPMGHVTGVTYRDSGEALMIRAILRQPLERKLGVAAYAFGYKTGTGFAVMPKISIRTVVGRLRVTHQGVTLSATQVRAEMTGREITMTIPWDLLGDPEAVFVQSQGLVGGLPVSQTSWRVLTREPTSASAKP